MTDPAREALMTLANAVEAAGDADFMNLHDKVVDVGLPIIRAAIEAEREAIVSDAERAFHDNRIVWRVVLDIRKIIRNRTDSGEAPSTQNPDATRSCAGALPPSELDAQERMRRAIIERFRNWHDKENVIPVIMGVRNDAGKVGYSYTEIHGDKEYKA